MDCVTKIIKIVDVNMRGCGCNKNINTGPYEFPVEYINKENIVIEDEYQTPDLCKLKYKIIQDFLDIINKLECGQKPDLEFLLEEISLIYIYDNE